MWLPGGFPLTSAAAVLQNFSIALLISADKFLICLGQRYRILNAVRFLLLNFILYLLAFISFFIKTFSSDHYALTLPTKDNRVSVYAGGGGGEGGDSAIARSLSQILSIVTDIPVTSRKYEVVRSMAERIIEENQQEGNQLLHEVNRSVLSSAFKRTLTRLEAAVAGSREWGWKTGNGLGDWPLSRVTAVVHSSLRHGWGTNRWDLISAEKLAAELLWLAQKLVACGSGDEAVRQWAAASNLSWFALTAEPQLQGSLLKVAALLIKEAKGMRSGATMEAMKMEPRKVKLKMLQTWLPFLCRATNGTDAPVLSWSQRSELQKVLEESIEELEDEQEREHVLFLWLHHFTHSSASDWPNLHGCYARWCSASRRQLMLLQENKKKRQLMLLQEIKKKKKKESDEIIDMKAFLIDQ